MDAILTEEARSAQEEAKLTADWVSAESKVVGDLRFARKELDSTLNPKP